MSNSLDKTTNEKCPNGICGDFWTYELGGSNPCPGRCGITKGKCLSGFCECLPRFSGDDCGSLRCPGSRCVYDKENNRLIDCNDCSGNGVCNDGLCTCKNGWKGETCNKVACPNDCSGHGSCKLEEGVGAICDCDAGFDTVDCSVGMILLFVVAKKPVFLISFRKLFAQMTAPCTLWKVKAWKWPIKIQVLKQKRTRLKIPSTRQLLLRMTAEREETVCAP
jgi:hypothetical protein